MSSKKQQANIFFDSGLDAEHADQMHHAERHYVAALRLYAAHTEALINLGRIYATQSEPLRALPLFRRAIMSAPDHGVAWFNLAVTEQDLGNISAARKAYHRCIRLDPALAHDATHNLRALESA